MINLITTFCIAMLLGQCAFAVGLYTETWDADDSGWESRDPGEMTVAWDSFGDPGGSLMGSFAAQGVPSPETDSYRATSSSSGGNFTGNYWSLASFNSWDFDFYAADVLPSDVFVRFNGNGSTFFRTVTPQISSLDTWENVSVSLQYTGWFGGTESAFSNALQSVDWIDIQITRNGTDQQIYYMDNFALSGDGGGGAVPEVSTALLMLCGATMIRLLRTSSKSDAVKKRKIGV